MKRIASALLAGFALAAIAGSAAAQQRMTFVPSPVVEARVDKTPIGDLMADARYRPILEKSAPAIAKYMDLGMIQATNLKAASAFPQIELDAKTLASIQKDFDRAK